MFSDDVLERYSRHILLKEIGISGQKKLSESKVLVIGAGGLGSPAALYLAAAGIGTLGIADGDKVDLSNLQRQIIHTTDDIGKAKTESAKRALGALNPLINIEAYKTHVNSDNILSIIKDYDFVIDATDNFSSKYLINDACVSIKKPFSHAGVIQFSGQTMTYADGAPCFRCVFSEMPDDGAPTCGQSGVLGAVPGIIGTIQAAEAVKYILGIGEPLCGKLLVFDALKMDFRKVTVKKNETCAACGAKGSFGEKIYETHECHLSK
jgi:molybdopterin/thiamine biosynthesis adenylyltransferase